MEFIKWTKKYETDYKCAIIFHGMNYSYYLGLLLYYDLTIETDLISIHINTA